MAREQITFTEINVHSLSMATQQAWAEYLRAKQTFKDILNDDHAPTGKRIVFTEKYNKLKVAVVAKAESTGKAAKSLAEVLGERELDGLAS